MTNNLPDLTNPKTLATRLARLVADVWQINIKVEELSGKAFTAWRETRDLGVQIPTGPYTNIYEEYSALRDSLVEILDALVDYDVPQQGGDDPARDALERFDHIASLLKNAKDREGITSIEADEIRKRLLEVHQSLLILQGFIFPVLLRDILPGKSKVPEAFRKWWHEIRDQISTFL